MRARQTIIFGLAVMLCVTLLVPPVTAEGTTDLSAQITTETGTTTDFGGGDHFYLRFGSDAAFGLVWGTGENENNIYLVTAMTRYLGYADVYNAQGNALVEDHVVKVHTVYAVKFDSLVEFDDGSGDGTVRYYRTYNDTSGEFSDYFALRPAVEPLYKRVDLRTAWNQSDVTYTEEGGVRTWSFSLSASNLTYEEIRSGTNTSVGNGVLDDLTLTFNLQATTTHVDDIAVPQWNVTMSSGGFVREVQQGEDMSFNGNVTSYNVKWDKDIEGWDFDPANAHPALLMEYGSIVGNNVPEGVVATMSTWQYRHMVTAMGEDGTMIANTGTERSLNETTGVIGENQQALRTARLTFGGDKTKIATFEWVQNVTVDGALEESHSQVVAVWPVLAMNYRGNVFAGFVALTGITFPGGDSIVQDPSVSTEIMTDLAVSTDAQEDGGSPLGQFAGLLLIGVVCMAIIVVVALMVTRRRGKSGPGTFDRKTGNEPKDWSKYYEKK